MRDQGNTFNSFMEMIYGDHGLSVSTHEIVNQNVFPSTALPHYGHDIISVLGYGSGQVFPGRDTERNFLHFQENGYQLPRNNFNDSAHAFNRGLNMVHEANINDSFYQNVPAISTYNQSMPTNGVSGYVLEDDVVLHGFSSEGRRLSHKRRAPENIREVYMGESSSSLALQPGNYKRQAIPYNFDANNNLNMSTCPINTLSINPLGQWQGGIGHGSVRLVSSILQTPSDVSQRESFQGNIYYHDLSPPNIMSTRTIVSPQDQFLRQPSISFYQGSSLNLFPEQVPSVVWTNWPTFGMPSTFPTNLVNQVNTLGHRENWGNIAPKIPEGGDLTNATTINFLNEATNKPLSIASSSRNGYASFTHPWYTATWVPQQNLSQQYAQTSQTVNQPMATYHGHSYYPLVLGTSGASQTIPFSNWDCYIRPYSQTRLPQRTIFGSQIDEHLRTSSASLSPQQRRLVEELDFDYLLLCFAHLEDLEDDRSDDNDDDDDEEEDDDDDDDDDDDNDSNIDIDNMSYEELLSLEERFQIICTGLSETVILKNLKKQKYRCNTIDANENGELCCICQEDYVDGENMGVLNCRHDFHVKCITQWLTHKNTCPICKVIALDASNQEV